MWRREDARSAGIGLGCLTVVLAVLAWFMITLVLTVPLHLPKTTAQLVSAAITAVIVVVILLTSKRYRAAHRAKNYFVLDSAGITQREAHGTRTLSWEGLRAAGVVPPMQPVRGNKGRPTDPTRQVPQLSPIGLLGVGAMSPDTGASRFVVNQYQANTTRWGQDPETGDHLVGINPSRVIESGRWDQSPVGDYLRHHRPDLWPAVQQQFDQNQ